MKKKKGYNLMLGLTIVLALGAVMTVIPSEASKMCLLRYNAHCSITPISTVICLLGAGLTCVIRKRKFTEND